MTSAFGCLISGQKWLEGNTEASGEEKHSTAVTPHYSWDFFPWSQYTYIPHDLTFNSEVLRIIFPFSFTPYHLWREAVSMQTSNLQCVLHYIRKTSPLNRNDVTSHNTSDCSQRTRTCFPTLFWLNIYHFPSSSIHPEISLFHGNSNWQVKTWTNL